VAITSFGCTQELSPEFVSNELRTFFGSEQYTVLSEALKVSDKSFFVAVRYVDESSEIFSDAIIYEVTTTGLIAQIIIDNGIITNNRDVVLSNVRERHRFYGYSIFFSYPTNPGFSPGFVFTGYLDEGSITADPSIDIVWNRNEQVFEKYVLDWDNL
jgi:hypothetical protein